MSKKASGKPVLKKRREKEGLKKEKGAPTMKSGRGDLREKGATRNIQKNTKINE